MLDFEILFSLSKGYYCKVTGDIVVTQELLEMVKKRMLSSSVTQVPGSQNQLKPYKN